jgi:hypothetical protein
VNSEWNISKVKSFIPFSDFQKGACQIIPGQSELQERVGKRCVFLKAKNQFIQSWIN